MTSCGGLKLLGCIGSSRLDQGSWVGSTSSRCSSRACSGWGWGMIGGSWPLAGMQPQAGQGLEDEPAGGFGGLADVQALEGDGGGDGAADLAFDQAEDQQRQADHGDQRLDAPVGLQKHRRDRQRALERAVAALDDFLALVAGQHLGGVDLGGVQVGQQRIPAVGGGLGGQRGLVEAPGQGRFAGGRVGADLGAQQAADPAGLAMAARRAWTLSTVG